MSRAGEEDGQAAVELVAMLPFVVILVAALWQAALAGATVWSAGAAARAAARAHAVGLDATSAARGAVPLRLRRGLRVRTGSDGRVTVTLRVPTLVGGGRLGGVDARARFEPQGP